MTFLKLNICGVEALRISLLCSAFAAAKLTLPVKTARASLMVYGNCSHIRFVIQPVCRNFLHVASSLALSPG